MSIKKLSTVFFTILIIGLLAINTHFTLDNKVKIQGSSITDLPPPPQMPSVESPSYSGFSADTELEALKMKVSELTSESQSINTIKSQQDRMDQRITDLQQDILRLQNKVDSLQGTEGSSGFVFGTIIDIILLLGLGGIIGYGYYLKRKEEDKHVSIIKEYLNVNIQQGYTQEELIPYLKQSGYKQKDIDKAISTLNI